MRKNLMYLCKFSVDPLERVHMVDHALGGADHHGCLALDPGGGPHKLLLLVQILLGVGPGDEAAALL